MRVAIVNDLALAREVLKKTILSVPGYSLAWIAEDGETAIRNAAADRPDAILMDLIMPGVDGVEATKAIMAKCPCPILLVTVSVSGNFNKVMEAMNHGGIDAVNTPTLGANGAILDAEKLLQKLDKIAKSRKSPNTFNVSVPISSSAKNTDVRSLPPLVVIGASTGGPQAIGKILSDLPADFPGIVLIAQHIEADFASRMVLTLGHQTPLKVVAAKPDVELVPGTVYLACTNDHMIMTSSRRLDYVREPMAYPFRPSVDVLFQSVRVNWPKTGVAALLTGMGKDGAKGLLDLRRAGWQTIAQDQASCVVYGMPMEAAELNAASQILPLDRIGPMIRLLSKHGG